MVLSNPPTEGVGVAYPPAEGVPPQRGVTPRMRGRVAAIIRKNPLVGANFQKIFERLAVTRGEVGDVSLDDMLDKGLLD